MLARLAPYAQWLHLQWPAGEVEKLPEVASDGSTVVPGLYVAGDLAGIPLLKFSADSGVRAVRAILAWEGLRRQGTGAYDLAIIGAGVAGMAAALEARKAGLNFVVVESSRPFSTLANFPAGKPIYTYPLAMVPAGELQFRAKVKETLIQEVEAQTQGVEVKAGVVTHVSRDSQNLVVNLKDGEPLQASAVLVAIGRSGNFRSLGVPGQDLPHVVNRLHDPREHRGQRVVVVGGGDSAVEAAIALAQAGAQVTLTYRGESFNRPKPDNVAAMVALSQGPTPPLRIVLGSRLDHIDVDRVVLKLATGQAEEIPCSVVYSLIGREAPLAFFRRSGVPIRGEWTRGNIISCVLFTLFCVALYNWKSGGLLSDLAYNAGIFPFSIEKWLTPLAASLPGVTGTFIKTLSISASGPSFWYTLVYSGLVMGLGVARVMRRPTPYVRLQTLCLALVQLIPLFLLPEIILPMMGYLGTLPQALADALFPLCNYGHGREYWRAYGLILAWPLNIYNWQTEQPLWAWIGIGSFQTFVLIPWLVYRYGKGAYCGWICSCGALAETLGDSHRQKMPHGKRWNRLNMIGQGILAFATLMMILRILTWIFPDIWWLKSLVTVAKDGSGVEGWKRWIFSWLNYKWTVDVFLAGVVGYGLYFWASGRTWCRFACPLAALMHIYSRFSRFRIFADKKKCISCNVCTTVCHQGIDIMNFANKGLAMSDPECVRCSACVEQCPTGTLAFGQIGADGVTISLDRVIASPVHLRMGPPDPGKMTP